MSNCVNIEEAFSPFKLSHTIPSTHLHGSCMIIFLYHPPVMVLKVLVIFSSSLFIIS